MSYLLFMYLFVGSFLHFVYQSIIAPALREDLRDNLLQLARELSLVERGEPASPLVLSDLRESHRRLLDALGRISLVALLEVERDLRDNLALRAQVAARSVRFERCDLAGLRRIRARTLRIAVQAIAVNNGGMIFYILPALPFLFATARFREWFSRLTVQAIDLHQQLGPAYFGVKHDVPGF